MKQETKQSELGLRRKKDEAEEYSIEVDKGLKIEDVDARIEEKLKTAKEEVLNNAKIEIDKQMQTAQASFITVFGLFASITSFLTIEFQFLKGLTNINQVIGFTFILCALLLGFNIALDYLVKSRLDQNNPKPNIWFSIMTLLMLIMGIVFIIYGNKIVSH